MIWKKSILCFFNLSWFNIYFFSIWDTDSISFRSYTKLFSTRVVEKRTYVKKSQKHPKHKYSVTFLKSRKQPLLIRFCLNTFLPETWNKKTEFGHNVAKKSLQSFLENKHSSQKKSLSLCKIQNEKTSSLHILSGLFRYQNGL